MAANNSYYVKLVYFSIVLYSLYSTSVALPTKAETPSRSRALKSPPAYRNQIVSSRAGQGRNIQPLPCQDKKGARGVCMFAWNCAEAGGTHLGTCVDRFYFGSCCKLPVVIKPEDLDQMNSETDIQTDPSESIAAPVSKPKPSSTISVTSTEKPSTTSETTTKTTTVTSTTSSTTTTATTTTTVTSSTPTTSSTTISTTPTVLQPIVTTTKSTTIEKITTEDSFAWITGPAKDPSLNEDTKEPTTTISTTTSTEETKVEITPPSAISVSASINLNNQMNSDIATSTESKPAGPEAVAAPVGTTEKPVEPVAPEGDVQVTTITVTQGSTSKPTSAPSTVSSNSTTEKSTTVMGLPVIQETDENSILFPTRNNQSNAIWQDQMDLDDVMALIESQTHTEVCGRRPWKNVKYYNQIYPAGHKSGTGFSEAPIGGAGVTKQEVPPSVMQSVRRASRRRNSKMDSNLWGSDQQSHRGGRIVQGELADYGEWPWQISLRQWRTATYIHKCGCALLSENWAITAAHCVENVSPDDLLLRMGEYDLGSTDEPQGHVDRKVQIVASHPKFDPKTFEYDLALLRFYEPVEFSPNVIPICIPEEDQELVGETAWVTGWGRLYEEGPLPSTLQEVSLPIIDNAECEGMYRDAGYIEHIPAIFICAGYKKGGKDSCEGDSGGPMVVQRQDGRFILSGIISWGIGCAEENQPGVYTRISEFRDWIEQILQF